MAFWGFLVDQLVKNLPAMQETPGSVPESGSSPGEGIGYPLWHSWAFLVAQTVKNLATTRETWVRSLGWEDPLEEGMATHSSIITWRIPWTEEPGGLQPMGLHRVGHDWATKHSTAWHSGVLPAQSIQNMQGRLIKKEDIQLVWHTVSKIWVSEWLSSISEKLKITTQD